MPKERLILGPECFMLAEWVIHVEELDLPWYLKPFGDTHIDSHLHAKDNWRRWCERARKQPRNLYIGVGDYHELHSMSERKRLRDPELHDSEKMRQFSYYEAATEEFHSDIGFMAGWLIGLIEGGHYGILGDNSTTTEYLCHLFNQRMPESRKCKYLGCMAVVRLTFKYKEYETKVDICIHHGLGAARLMGGSLNRVQYMGEGVIADVYIMMHDHKIVAGIPQRIRLHRMPDGELDVVAEEPIYMRGGGMTKAYVPRRPSYVAKGAKNPVAIRLSTLMMVPRMGDSERRGFYMELTPVLGDMPERL